MLPMLPAAIAYGLPPSVQRLISTVTKHPQAAMHHVHKLAHHARRHIVKAH
jgi:hypothetical protein